MSRGGWDLDEIRRRADIVEIISPHVRLRKAGRRLAGLCPFHQEKTPSFTVDPEKGLWHCFGCKAGGDVFGFVEAVEKVTFQEAVELLAHRLGLPPRTPAAAAQGRLKERLLSLHEEAARWFHQGLKGRAGAGARSYLKRRGVAPESVDRFLLGYVLDEWDGLLRAMERNGYAPRELVRAGLAIARDDGGCYDRFRGRLIFPIADPTGRTIAFGGRALADGQQPKYLNSPETLLFQKNRTLYAFDQARRAMADRGRAIVVEGYLDAIACHEAGLVETVATLGTALTGEHVELLRRRTERLILAFDSDSAGMAAALRSVELFRRAELDVRVLALPAGADPDSLIRAQGADAFGGLAEAAVPIVEWEITRVLGEASGRGEREQAMALRRAVAVLARVPAGVEREYYVQWLAREAAGGSAARLATSEAAIRDELQQQTARKEPSGRRTAESPQERPSASSVPGRPPGGRIPSSLLAALLEHPELAPQYVPMLEREDFPQPEQQEVFDALVRLVERGEPVTAQALLAEADSGARSVLAGLALEEVPQDRVESYLDGLVRRVTETRLRRRQRELQQRLAEPLSPGEQESVHRELAEVTRRRSELAGDRIVGGG